MSQNWPSTLKNWLNRFCETVKNDSFWVIWVHFQPWRYECGTRTPPNCAKFRIGQAQKSYREHWSLPKFEVHKAFSKEISLLPYDFVHFCSFSPTLTIGSFYGNRSASTYLKGKDVAEICWQISFVWLYSTIILLSRLNHHHCYLNPVLDINMETFNYTIFPLICYTENHLWTNTPPFFLKRILNSGSY